MAAAPRRGEMKVSGFLNVHKPAGLTSRDVVDRVTRVAGTKRVGHAGTLDPLATGVLVVAIERATRLIEYVQRSPKTYEAEFLLGQTSDTDDAEGLIEIEEGCDAPDKSAVQAALASFVGSIKQMPPQFSAVKVAGQRAYKLARRGLAIELQPRTVIIHQIELLMYSFPRIRLRIVCGSGTYIRSIARDLGVKLGTGALMSQLERTAVGSFHLDSAATLDSLTAENWMSRVLPLERALDSVPRITLSATLVARFHNGQLIPATDMATTAGEVAVFDEAARFVGIGESSSTGIRPRKGGFNDPPAAALRESPGPRQIE